METIDMAIRDYARARDLPRALRASWVCGRGCRISALAHVWSLYISCVLRNPS